jgi:SET domain-containing protein
MTPPEVQSKPVPDWLVFQASPIHGTGGFARRPIPRGTRVIEYRGEEITKAESLRRCELENPFIFALDAERDLDGNVAWNPARLLNHSCDPNCEALKEEGCIWITARREIMAGEEVTFNYGYELVDYEDHPCRCGAYGCAGYMVAEEYLEHVRSRGAAGEAADEGGGQRGSVEERTGSDRI